MSAAFAVFRPRRWPGPALALGLCIACAPPAQGPLAGSSDNWKKTSEPVRPPAAPAPAWEAYAEAKHWPTANTAPFISHGHQPEQAVDVRVSPAIRATYSGLVVDSVFPEGSVLIELSHIDGGSGYAMRKETGSWRFYALDARGGVLASGALSLCAGCHTQAPSDGVFGLPRVPSEPH